MFHRIGAAALKNNLDNTIALDNYFEHPHKSYKTIHIAGTNGKGSVSHLLASIFQQAGFKTGLYTSPHLKDFRERIRINGEMIPEEDVTAFIEDFLRLNKTPKIEPSFFELTMSMAFDYFRKENVDIAIVEVGLGGRLDSTNIITPEISVITNISFDHVNILGDTLEKIAAEKAGIIKENIPVVIGETQSETEQVFRNTAKSKNSEIRFADQEYLIKNLNNGHFKVFSAKTKTTKEIELDLKGCYQQKNLATVLLTVDVLNEKGFNLSEEIVKEALKSAAKNTGLLGRWQQIGENPRIICDTGHNEGGITLVTQQLQNEKYEHLHIVFGMVNDKEIDKVLALLPKSATYYFTRASIERALDENELMLKASKYNLVGKSYSSTQKALEAAKENASTNDLIFVGGSTFIVAEVI
jgi:dihydrofolate synthase/folylpolyglutamate synthase